MEKIIKILKKTIKTIKIKKVLKPKNHILSKKIENKKKIDWLKRAI